MKAVVLIAGCVLFATLQRFAVVQINPNAQRLPLTVSPEITIVTEPRMADGRVDYCEYLNQTQGAGVTPDNNAAVAILEATGPRWLPEDGAYRQRFFQLAGIPEPPETDSDFVNAYDYGNARFKGAARDAFRDDSFTVVTLRHGPWQASGYPAVAEWLDANQEALDHVVAGLAREKFYLPWVRLDADKSLLDSWPWRVLMEIRDLNEAIQTRAMRLIAEGDFAGARRDLLACHRLARLTAQGGQLVEVLVAQAYESGACVGDWFLMAADGLPAGFCRDYLRELDDLGPLASVADSLESTEAVLYVDAVETVVRTRSPELIRWLDVDARLERILRRRGNAAVNWNEVLRAMNQQRQQIAAAFRLPTQVSRDHVLRTLEPGKPLPPPRCLFRSGGRREVFDGWRQKEITAYVISCLLPAMTGDRESMRRSQSVARARQNITRTGLALVSYREEHGRWPEELQRLVPEFLDEIPHDPFTDQPLKCRPTADGFRLYSIWLDGHDDGGQSREETGDGQRHDIVLQWPLPSNQE